MLKMVRFFSTAFLFLFLCTSASADILTLKNGDKLKVDPVREDDGTWTVRHEQLGEIKILKNSIESFEPDIRKPAEPQRGDLKTQASLSAGYELNKGNTETEQFQGDFLYNRNRLWIDEWTVKGNGLKSYANDESTAQRYESSLRYGYSLTKKLYDFARIAVEHDYFQDVKIRIVPTAGLGYWFVDTEKTKFLAEAGTGYEYEVLRSESNESEGSWILHGRLMGSRQLTEKLKVLGEIYYFPEVLDFGSYRLQADAGLEYAFNKHWGLKFQLQDRYRSNPPAGAESNDIRLITGLRFSL